MCFGLLLYIHLEGRRRSDHVTTRVGIDLFSFPSTFITETKRSSPCCRRRQTIVRVHWVPRVSPGLIVFPILSRSQRARTMSKFFIRSHNDNATLQSSISMLCTFSSSTFLIEKTKQNKKQTDEQSSIVPRRTIRRLVIT